MTELTATVYVVDDDEPVRDSIGMLLDTVDIRHESYQSATAFIEGYQGHQTGCLILDIRMPGMSGLELQDHLKECQDPLPIIFITGHGDVPMAVEAMRQGALDFLRKPVNEEGFLERIANALDRETGDWHQKLDREQARQRIATLSEREHEVFHLVAEGYANKAVAAELGISERTVEVHRSQAMKKLGAKTLAQMVRIHLQSE